MAIDARDRYLAHVIAYIRVMRVNSNVPIVSRANP
jgi:hypothetical protein